MTEESNKTPFNKPLNGIKPTSDTGLHATYQDFEDPENEEGLEEDYYGRVEGEEEDDLYEDDEEGAYPQATPLDPYSLAQQLAGSPLFSQLQALLGGNSSVEGRLNSARLKQATGDLAGAAEIYLDVIEEDPEHQKAHVALGQILLGMDRPGEAENFLSKATELDPEDAAAFLYLGYAYYAQENFEACVVNFKRSTELDPDNHIALNNLGYAQFLVGQLEEAEKTFVKAGDVGSERAYYNLGMVRLLQGNEEKAWEAYQDAAELDPRGGQIEDHLLDLEKAKTLFPEKSNLLDQARSSLESRLGEWDEDDEDDEDEDYDEDDEDDEEDEDYDEDDEDEAVRPPGLEPKRPKAGQE